jgi:hypothetical protein
VVSSNSRAYWWTTAQPTRRLVVRQLDPDFRYRYRPDGGEPSAKNLGIRARPLRRVSRPEERAFLESGLADRIRSWGYAAFDRGDSALARARHAESLMLHKARPSAWF